MQGRFGRGVETSVVQRFLACGDPRHGFARIYCDQCRHACILAQYMLRAPFSLEKMSYDTESCTVIYRSRMHKTFKRYFQIMHGADWLAQLCAHIPDRFEHLVRAACAPPGRA